MPLNRIRGNFSEMASTVPGFKHMSLPPCEVPSQVLLVNGKVNVLNWHISSKKTDIRHCGLEGQYVKSLALLLWNEKCPTFSIPRAYFAGAISPPHFCTNPISIHSLHNTCLFLHKYVWPWIVEIQIQTTVLAPSAKATLISSGILSSKFAC